MDYAHVFRKDKVNHVVLSKKRHVRRDGYYTVTVCALYVDKTFQRRTSSGNAIAAVTCDRCLRFMHALEVIMDKEEEEQSDEQSDST